MLLEMPHKSEYFYFKQRQTSFEYSIVGAIKEFFKKINSDFGHLIGLQK